MKFKELSVKARVNKANGQINISLPKKQFSIKELDDIQKNKSIKLLMKENE